MGTKLAAVLFSIFALLELIADMLPQTPKRTALLPLGARILTGGLCGACLCAAHRESLELGGLFGAVGGVVGAFTGYQIRKWFVTVLNTKDLLIALAEDCIAIGMACFLVTR